MRQKLGQANSKSYVFLNQGISLFLFGLCLLVFWPVLGHSFVNYDDLDYVAQNPYIAQGLTADSVAWALMPEDDWMPLSKLSHMAVVHFFGMKPAVHHAANLFLHALNAVLLFWVLRRGSGDAARSAVVAMLFAVHPVQAEAVSWVTARKDLLACLFSLLALYFFMERRRMIVVAVFFVLSLLSKPSLVALPALLVFLDKAGSKKIWPLFLSSLVVCGVTLGVQNKAIAYDSASGPLWHALSQYLFYLEKCFFPASLGIYGRVPDQALPLSRVLLSAAVLGGLSATALSLRKKYPLSAFAWLAFLILLAPVTVLEVPADRYLYFPMIGIAMAVVWLLPKKPALILSLVCLTVLSPLARAQCELWKDSRTLFTHALAMNEKNITAHGNLAETLVNAGHLPEAKEHYRRALELKPDNVEALTSLGVLCEKEGDLSQAEHLQRRALSLGPGNAKAHFNLGNVLEKKGALSEALNHYRQAGRLRSGQAEAYFNAAGILERQGDVSEAILQYQKALQIHPGYTAAHNNLALLLTEARQYPEAIAHFREGLKEDAQNVDIRNNLAVTLARSGDRDAARQELEKILKENPGDLSAASNLKRLLRKTAS